jgi:regulator of replication initiation timing
MNTETGRAVNQRIEDLESEVAAMEQNAVVVQEQMEDLVKENEALIAENVRLHRELGSKDELGEGDEYGNEEVIIALADENEELINTNSELTRKLAYANEAIEGLLDVVHSLRNMES